ncbi:MAG TPA: cellulose biosynthesis cyclic di-GMP-binding regulatory protein BcsB [Rhodocyclaceae bacterium]|nr:cellulose biosynthesis cyclic di-GMP-binding regulatory protein BcsB [Rhodocyclaceae bacterium]
MSKRLLLSLGLALTLSASGMVNANPAARPVAQPAVKSAAQSASLVTDPLVEVRRVTLKSLTGTPKVELRTTEGAANISFGSRADELVTKAVLHLRYIYSPALIANQSHIKVILNDEVVGLAPITKEKAGQQVDMDIPIDPRYIADFNRLQLRFVGHYATECEDPLHTSLWADVSGLSELQLTVRHLRVADDLSMLPEPFFDRRDLNKLVLPFVFAAKPSQGSLRAAGEVASWFGALAQWRGARFPANLNTVPKGNAVVFATNSERPAFLSEMKPVDGPTVAIMNNAADGYSKLLLVLGRDAKDLKQAADALVLGSTGFSGPRMVIRESREIKPRQPYDAPNWVRMDRPMRFGELITSPQELQVFGHVPDLVRVSLRIPPDLFTWRSRGVPVDLKYRYTPPIRVGESRVTMAINDELVQSFNLRSSGQGGDSSRIRLPLLDDGLLSESKEVLIPAFKLGSRNQLQFGFSFTYHKEGNCRDTQVENVRAMVDADSTVDFSGYPHYVEMPHVGYFASSGFPFTKYADLSQTVAVLPEQPTAADVQTYLTLLGHMGESTGYPAVGLRVANPSEAGALKDADLLVVGTSGNMDLLKRWSDKLPAVIDGGNRIVSQPVRGVSFLYDWFGFGTKPDPAVASQERMEGGGALAALLGFESPVTSGRSVVAVTAVAPEDLSLALDALDNPGLVKGMHGSAVFVHAGHVDSVLAGDTYSLGHIPFWTAIWYPLSEHPVLLAVMSVLAVVIFAFALWRTLRAIAAKRLLDGDE